MPWQDFDYLAKHFTWSPYSKSLGDTWKSFLQATLQLMISALLMDFVVILLPPPFPLLMDQPLPLVHGTVHLNKTIVNGWWKTRMIFCGPEIKVPLPVLIPGLRMTTLRYHQRLVSFINRCSFTQSL